MAKYRVMARSISYVYIDVDAKDEREAIEIAEAADGGEYSDTSEGDWIIDGAEEISGNQEKERTN